MGFEGPSQAPPAPKVEESSERVEDVAKAQEMAQAGRSERNVAAEYGQQLQEQKAAVDELQNNPEMAWQKRGDLDSLGARQYRAGQLEKSKIGWETNAEMKEEIAGIIYDLQNPGASKLDQLSQEDLNKIKEVIEEVKKKSRF